MDPAVAPLPAPDLGRAPAVPGTFDPLELEDLRARLDALHVAMTELERALLEAHPGVHPAYRESARNLAHYLALRRHDERSLQGRLHRLGLSSLGRGESHVLENVDAVRRVLYGLLHRPWPQGSPGTPRGKGDRGDAGLESHTEALFGPRPRGRRTHVMVTLPSEAATDPRIARDLVLAGMDVARVNCAHDDPVVWSAILANVRKAASDADRPVRVLMDLAGPKLRTGAIQPGPAALHWAPTRDARGQTTAPARVFLSAEPPGCSPPDRVDATLYPPRDWVRSLAPGDSVEWTDLRGRPRRLEIVTTSDRGALGATGDSAWIDPTTRLAARHAGARVLGPDVSVGWIPPTETRLVVRPGDLLVLTRDARPGRPAALDSTGRVVAPATIPCTLPEVFARCAPGQPVWLDDGKIGGRVRSVGPDALVVEIVQAKAEGSRLGADKGINLPATDLALPGLTAKDLADVEFVARHADLVALSFVNDPSDVHLLWRRLAQLPDRRPGVILKIETRRGFERLPEILLAGMEGHPLGVMIARGDLAVECGFERLAEVQEEILWICESAHVPVVWATQVLETLAKKGLPTRAEITDAAMSERAECVMLNKGPHVVQAVRALDDILRRMQEHQSKKHAMLRSLRVSEIAPRP